MTETTRHTPLLIIGSGPAGYSAAVYGARAMLSPLLIQGMEPGGQLTTTTEVENWPGDTEVQGPDLMTRMQAHAAAMGTEIISDIITRLDLKTPPIPRLFRQWHDIYQRRTYPSNGGARQMAGAGKRRQIQRIRRVRLCHL